MKQKDFSYLLFNAANAGALKALAETDDLSSQISKTDAYRLCGQSNVNRWISGNSITPAVGRRSFKDLIDPLLDRMTASSNRLTYLPVVDGKQ